MTIKLDPNNPSFLLKNNIQELTHDFLQCYGFNYFQFLRCFIDGTASLLTNDIRLLEYVSSVDNSPVIFSSFDTEDKNVHSFCFLWDEKLPEFPVKLARERMNLHNGFTIVRRSEKYYDMVAFAFPHPQGAPASFYLNHLKILIKYIDYFEIRHKNLISIVNENPLIIPEPYRDVNYQKICIKNNKIYVIGKFGTSTISAQEATCLRWFLQGASYKETANILEISPRSVETYLLRVKEKTGFTSFSELKDQLMHLFL